MRRAFAALASLVAALFSRSGAATEPGGQMDRSKLMNAGEITATLRDADAAKLDLAAFLALKKQGPVVVLDIRSAAAFEAKHLVGAVSLPLTELTEKTLPKVIPTKDTPVALMCEDSLGPTRMVAGTYQAYPVLKASGYTKIYRLELWHDANEKFVPEPELQKALEFEGKEVKKK